MAFRGVWPETHIHVRRVALDADAVRWFRDRHPEELSHLAHAMGTLSTHDGDGGRGSGVTVELNVGDRVQAQLDGWDRYYGGKVTARDLFGFEAKAEEKVSEKVDVKDFRMQGNYGATKFIKP